MIALIEFIVVGLIFFGMMKLSYAGKEIRNDRKITLKQMIKKTMGEFWVYYIIPLGLIILALNIAYNIENWHAEMKGILLSAFMLFCGFFIATATYLRMKDAILGESLYKSE
jgi:cytochrome bd-type quinol oxidase subunit 2